jgi:hypothetical protein
MCRIVNEMQFHELISGEVCIQGGNEQAKVVFLLSGRLEAVDSGVCMLKTKLPSYIYLCSQSRGPGSQTLHPQLRGISVMKAYDLPVSEQ